MLSTLLYNASNAILVLLGLSAGVFVLIAWASRGRLARLRTAYLGYAVCALSIAWFQLQVYASRGVAYMIIGIVLVPIAIAGTLAIGNTVGARSATLRVLGGGTVVVVLLLILDGIWGIARPLNMGVAHAYEVLVLAACVYRRGEWWPRQGQRDD